MLASSAQITEDATRPTDAVTGIVGIADEIELARTFPGTLAVRFVQPGIEPSSRYPQHTAHQRIVISATMLVHEAVLHSGSLTKYHVAFLEDPAPPRSAAAANAGAGSRSWLPAATWIAARYDRATPSCPTCKGCAPTHPDGPQHPARIAPLNNLTDRLILELWGKSL